MKGRLTVLAKGAFPQSIHSLASSKNTNPQGLVAVNYVHSARQVKQKQRGETGESDQENQRLQ